MLYYARETGRARAVISSEILYKTHSSSHFILSSLKRRSKMHWTVLVNYYFCPFLSVSLNEKKAHLLFLLPVISLCLPHTPTSRSLESQQDRSDTNEKKKKNNEKEKDIK